MKISDKFKSILGAKSTVANNLIWVMDKKPSKVFSPEPACLNSKASNSIRILSEKTFYSSYKV